MGDVEEIGVDVIAGLQGRQQVGVYGAVTTDVLVHEEDLQASLAGQGPVGDRYKHDRRGPSDRDRVTSATGGEPGLCERAWGAVAEHLVRVERWRELVGSTRWGPLPSSP